ncbi:hypothetical protein AAG906_000067 [Vitis piasezkii]
MSGTILHGCMHLVDQADSERVDKFEVNGDRLKEAQQHREFVIPLAKYRKSIYGTQIAIGMRFGMMFETKESGKRRQLDKPDVHPDYLNELSDSQAFSRQTSRQLGATLSSNMDFDESGLLHNSYWQQVTPPPMRTYTKVQIMGSVGRSIDVASFKNYAELCLAIECMFGLEGLLNDRKRQPEIGIAPPDLPLNIRSLALVPMVKMETLASSELIINPSNLGCTPQAEIRQLFIRASVVALQKRARCLGDTMSRACIPISLHSLIGREKEQDYNLGIQSPEGKKRIATKNDLANKGRIMTN